MIGYKSIFFWDITDSYILLILQVYNYFEMKKILLSLSGNLFKKIEDYKDENEFPSILATIRYILNQFFKK